MITTFIYKVKLSYINFALIIDKNGEKMEFNISELENQNNNLTLVDKQLLTETFQQSYKLIHNSEGTFFETTKGLIRKQKVTNYNILSRKTAYPETNIKPEKQIARWMDGLPLEKLIQYSLDLEHIAFSGNPTNIKHYAHSANSKYNNEKSHCDIETFLMLIEATNPRKGTWLNDEIMNEKIDYFLHDDPEHEKQWLIITSYKKWNKAIDKRIKELNIQVLILNTCINRHTVKNQYYNDLRLFLKELTDKNSIIELLTKRNKSHQKINSKHRVNYQYISNQTELNTNEYLNNDDKLNTVYEKVNSQSLSSINGVCKEFPINYIGLVSDG